MTIERAIEDHLSKNPHDWTFEVELKHTRWYNPPHKCEQNVSLHCPRGLCQGKLFALRSDPPNVGSFKLRQALVSGGLWSVYYVEFTGPLGPCLYTQGSFLGEETLSRDFEEPVVSVLDFCHPAWWEVGSSHIPDFCSFISPFWFFLLIFSSCPYPMSPCAKQRPPFEEVIVEGDMTCAPRCHSQSSGSICPGANEMLSELKENRGIPAMVAFSAPEV